MNLLIVPSCGGFLASFLDKFLNRSCVFGEVRGCVRRLWSHGTRIDWR